MGELITTEKASEILLDKLDIGAVSVYSGRFTSGLVKRRDLTTIKRRFRDDR